ncbi:hypothetical protein RS82_01767 [Microbacterium trichothecenolyticum]|uniref:Uncharacterized protein n=1 Tax=Microbacterium trichothecenolyticum TaxID=69370 RepID=A0A0M2HEW0_MICTR|nr:hypothetical protein RS82_01767 [Microbacterium trichothecenolyticum]
MPRPAAGPTGPEAPGDAPAARGGGVGTVPSGVEVSYASAPCAMSARSRQLRAVTRSSATWRRSASAFS